MGCAEGTVKSTLYDARRRLRADLGEEPLDD
jgi:DNA-directed RNA polymerase specialized sigma24 family protein